MLPENIDIAPRLRNSHEAVDLGLKLIQTHRAIIYGPWLLGTLSIFFCIQFVLQDYSTSLRSTLFWWLSPLFEPLTLFILSRVIFKERPSFKEVIRQTPSLLFRGASLSFLTFWRFSPRRALLQPVFLLEGGKIGENWGKRRRLLGQGEPSFVLTTSIFAHAEVLLSVLFAMLVIWIVPSSWFDEALWHVDMEEFKFSVNHRVEELYLYCYAVAVCFCRPIYTAAGFSCYLSRRISLEAWDIELSFRQMARKVNKAKLLLILCFLGLTLPTEHLRAETSSTPESVMKVLLESDEFSTTQDVEHTFRFDKSKVEEPEKHDESSSPWKLDFDFSSLLKSLSLCLGIYLLGFLLHGAWKRRAQIHSIIKKIPTKAPPSSEHQALSFIKDPNTNFDPVAIQGLLEHSRFREATAAMFFHAVQALQKRHQVVIPAGATEHEVLRLFKTVVKTEQWKILKSIVQAWMSIAYAHRQSDRQDMEVLLSRCEGLMDAEDLIR